MTHVSSAHSFISSGFYLEVDELEVNAAKCALGSKSLSFKICEGLTEKRVSKVQNRAEYV